MITKEHKAELNEFFKAKTESKLIHSIEYNDFDKLVNNFLGTKSFSCVESGEWSNDCKHEFHPLTQSDMEQWAKIDGGYYSDIKAFLALPAAHRITCRKHLPDMHSIMIAMYYLKVIPQNVILSVDVSW